MKRELGVMLLGVLTMLGCSVRGRLYPIQGPLAAQSPLPVLLAKITFGENPKTISVNLGDGEICNGVWIEVPRAAKDVNTGTTTTTTGLSSLWDLIYGQGFYVSHVLGAKYYARSEASGNKGTVLNLEIYRPENTRGNLAAAVKGVAQDNKGNIYKVLLK